LAIAVKRLLDSYFTTDDLKNALYDIGEPVTESKDTLINRLIQVWPEHKKGLKDLLGYLSPQALVAMCQFYKLDDTGNEEALIKRIVKSGIIEPFGK
jgi:hypothetical protein